MPSLLGHGVDLVELADFGRLAETHGEHGHARIFTEEELAYAGEGVVRIPRLAVRFAAKEAVLKALGTGWTTGLSFKDVEVVTAANGAPSIVLSGGVAKLASAKGVRQVLISLTHTRSYALASAIAIGAGD
ncbi:MAG: holo-ACP synthase [Hyphomicrobium sp.]